MTIDQPGHLEPEVTVPPQEPAPPSDGLLETASGVVTEPVPTLRAVVRSAPLGQAFVVIAAGSCLSAITTVAQLRATPTAGVPPVFSIPEGPGVLVVAALLGPILGLISSVIYTAVLQVVALMLGGKGPFKGLFCGLAFASIPGLFQIPLQLAGIALGPVVQAILGIVTFAIAIWTIALGVIAVRENNDFSTGRAVAVMLIPMGVLFVLFVGLILLVVVFAVGGAAGLFSQ